MKIIKPLICLSLLMTVLLTVILFCGFDFNWYEKEFENSGVYESLDKALVLDQAQNLFDYFLWQEELNKSFYTQRELAHVFDIKNIITKVIIFDIIFMIIFIFSAGYLVIKKGIAQVLKLINAIAVGGLVFYLITAAVSYIHFENLFILFHQIFFKNDFWQLDPVTEKLIVIFPPELFLHLTQRIFIYLIFINFLFILFYKFFKSNLIKKTLNLDNKLKR